MTVHADFEALADALRAADLGGEPVAIRSELTRSDAYRVQSRNVEHRTDRGEHLVGYKIGLTAADSPGPIFGRLLSGMVVPTGGQIEPRVMLETQIEGELAVVLGEPVRGPGVTSANALAATRGITLAFDILVGRIAPPPSRPELMIADNASAAHVVLGSVLRPVTGVDLRLVGTLLSCDGQVIRSGVGAQALGHPGHAVAWLANELADLDEQLYPGDVVLTGSLTGAVPVLPGQGYLLEGDRLGSVAVRFVQR